MTMSMSMYDYVYDTNKTDVVCAASDEAAAESACNSQRQIYRHNKLSTQFTKIGVQN